MPDQWSLGLEQRDDLSISHGSTAQIADAVRRGANLRLYMTTEHYEETMYFQQTYAGADEAFAGLMTHHHSYTADNQITDQPYISLFRYDTSGTFSHLKWKIGNVTFDTSQAYPYGIYRWYIQDHWRLVYEHDAEGTRVSGDLNELKELVRLGRSIQVGIRQLFGLAQDNAGGPEHICFVTTMQPIIRDEHVESSSDFVLLGPAQWPFAFTDGFHLSMMRPSTSGRIVCFATEVGKLAFKRTMPRRAMQWMVAESV
jgi:hypothetical protein